MYIDESGMPDFRDNTKYYLLTGVIIHQDKIKQVKQDVFSYKHRHFKNGYVEAEIHTHNICKAKKEFSKLTHDEKFSLLDNLYIMINGLPVTTICVVINKILLEKIHPNWKIFNVAWNILTTRYNQFLEWGGTPVNGIIKTDKLSVIQSKDLKKLVDEIREREKKHQRIDNIVGDPIFVNSDATEGIQVADAISYCVTKYLDKNSNFQDYWKKIEVLFFDGFKGKVFGYGLNIFPVENKNEDTRP